MSLDDQIRQALDRALTGARGHLDADLRAFAQDALRAATEDRTRAVALASESSAADVRQKAHAQVLEIRDSAQRHTDEVRRSLEKQISDLKRALADASAQSEADIEDATRTAQMQVDDVQHELERRVAELQQRLTDSEHRLNQTERERDEARRASAVDADRKREDAVRQARASSEKGSLEQVLRLVHTVRMLDEARSLVDVLDVLGEGAAGEADRVAVLLVRDDQLAGWRMLGFDAAPPSARAMTLDREGAGFLASVVRSGSAESRSSADTKEGAGLPAFARDGGGGGACVSLALPLIVGGAVVVVLYADRRTGDVGADADRWVATLDVLARHASKVLEALTVQQAVGLSLPLPVARASHDAEAGPGHDRSVQ